VSQYYRKLQTASFSMMRIQFLQCTPMDRDCDTVSLHSRAIQ